MSARRDNLQKQCPCGPDRWAKCDHSWYVVYGRQWVSLDMHCKRRALPQVRLRGEADKFKLEILPQLMAGSYQANPAPTAQAQTAQAVQVKETMTFDQAWPKFTKAVLGGNPSRNSDESRLRQLGRVELDAGGLFGDLILCDITEAIIEEAYATYCEDKAEATKKKARNKLIRFFKWAAAKDHIEKTPITETTILKAGKGISRTRRLTPDEETNLLQAASETRSDAALRLIVIIVAAIDLALRVGELLALQWKDIRWTEGPFGRVLVAAREVGAQKAGEGEFRYVPMTPRLADWLRRLAATNPTGKPWPSTAYVFGDAVGGKVASIRKAWVTCVLRAHNILPAWVETALDATTLQHFKAIDLRFHDLRHEGAMRWYWEQGKKLNVVAALLGHKDMNTLKVYLGIRNQDAVEEAERLDVERLAIAEKTGRAVEFGPRSSKRAVKSGSGVVLPMKQREAQSA